MKTKLGISVPVLAGVAYLLGWFSGYLVLALLVGYVLLCETDEWLKKTVVRALAVSLIFSLAGAVIDLIPDAMSVIDALVGIFQKNFNIRFISAIINFFNVVLYVVEKVAMLGLAVMAFAGKNVKIPFIDDIIEKNM